MLNFRTATQVEMSVNLNKLWQNSDFYLDTNKVLKKTAAKLMLLKVVLLYI